MVNLYLMKQISVSKFKATCLELLSNVAKTGRPILITKKGKPLAQVVAPPPLQRESSWLGSMAAVTQIKGDLSAPIGNESDWDVLKK